MGIYREVGLQVLMHVPERQGGKINNEKISCTKGRE